MAGRYDFVLSGLSLRQVPDLRFGCETLFPGYHFDIVAEPRGIRLVWDAPQAGALHIKQDAPR